MEKYLVSQFNQYNEDNQVVYVNGSHYSVSVDHKGINTISSVTDEKVQPLWLSLIKKQIN